MFTNLVDFEEEYGPLIGMICGYLGCGSVRDIVDTELSDVEKDDDGYFEVWDLPSDFQVLLEIDNVQTPNFSIGKLWFGILNGVPCVAETNASPIAFYSKRILPEECSS